MADPELEAQIASLTLVPSDGGKFELSLDGELLFSKLESGRHPGETELVQILKAHLAGE